MKRLTVLLVPFMPATIAGSGIWLRTDIVAARRF
jgi:hypothetical protein